MSALESRPISAAHQRARPLDWTELPLKARLPGQELAVQARCELWGSGTPPSSATGNAVSGDLRLQLHIERIYRNLSYLFACTVAPRIPTQLQYACLRPGPRAESAPLALYTYAPLLATVNALRYSGSLPTLKEIVKLLGNPVGRV